MFFFNLFSVVSSAVRRAWPGLLMLLHVKFLVTQLNTIGSSWKVYISCITLRIAIGIQCLHVIVIVLPQ